MSTSLLRLALFVGCASLLISSAAAAQGWAGYPPPQADQPDAAYGPSDGAYPQKPYGPGAYSPYAQGAYAQQPYAQGPYYGQGAYAPDPYARAYDPYAAQRRAWRQHMQQQANAAPPQDADAPQPQQPAYARPPVDAAPAAPILAARATPPAALPAAPKSVALAHKIVESASAYLSYMKRASAIGAAFTDGAGVAREVRTGAAYEARQFEEGAIAYAAVMALQEPAFVEGVRTAGGGDNARAQEIAADLIANPAFATTFPGADGAVARAGAALRRQGDRLMAAGAKVKQSAYDVQHAAWSKGDVAEPQVSLAKAKALSSTRLTPGREETETLLKAVLAEQNAPGGYGASSPVVNRGLALAALAVLGQAGEGSAERVAPLLAEEHGGECLKMAKLNLFQCLAVAGPHYEDIFCLGQHAMMDTAQCVIKASGVSQPVMNAQAEPAPASVPQDVAQVSPAPQDYWAPLGGDAARK